MTIKQLGGVFGRNPTFNDVTIEGELTFDGDIDINSDLKVSGELEVVGNINSTGRMRAAGGSDQGTQLNMWTTAGGDGSLAAYQLVFNTGPNDARVEGARFTPSGNLAFISGKGIDFSATAGTGTSELLDDYEEGTWTPVVADASSGGNTASGTFYGHYTKVGNLVTITGSLRDINTSGMTTGNPIYVQGLPYTCSSLTGTVIFTGSVQATTLSFSGFVSGSVADGTSYLRFFDTSSGGGFSTVPLSAITSGTTDIYFTTTYQA
jgi:hypothetical protein